MSEFGPEAMAVEWLTDHFAANEQLSHLRARRRGRVVTVESGPAKDAVRHARFRRDTRWLWLLEMPSKGGRWDRTPFRDQIENLMALIETEFPWTLVPIAGPDPDGTSDPGY